MAKDPWACLGLQCVVCSVKGAMRTVVCNVNIEVVVSMLHSAQCRADSASLVHFVVCTSCLLNS